MSEPQRPAWLVIAPISLDAAKRAIAKVHFGERALIEGRDGNLAIVEYEQNGGDGDKLAQQLSRGRRTYSLYCDWEWPRSTGVYERGKQIGNLFASVDDIARALGCKVPGLKSGRGKVELTPERPATRKREEWVAGGRTVSEWRHLMKEADWSVMLDDLSPKTAEQLQASLAHEEREIRSLSCKLLAVAGIHNLGALVKPVADRMLALAKADPDKQLRAQAAEAGAELVDAIERQRVMERYPWLLDYTPKRTAEAIALLDRPDPALVLQLYRWFSNTWELTKPQRTAVLKKLRAHAKAGATGYSLTEAIARLSSP